MHVEGARRNGAIHRQMLECTSDPSLRYATALGNPIPSPWAHYRYLLCASAVTALSRSLSAATGGLRDLYRWSLPTY